MSACQEGETPVTILIPSGAFNPNLEDPVPGRMKKQLVLKVISGQQLPKPKDSMLGDRGEVLQHTSPPHTRVLSSDDART